MCENPRLQIDIGGRVRGAYWLNFFGENILSRLGGIEVSALPGGKAVEAIGACAEVRGDAPSRYKKLSEILNPALYKSSSPFPTFTPEETHQRERRLLAFPPEPPGVRGRTS
ncbi:MAG TPA: hypothetical protein VNI02_07665 [Blastocatellia bacterium]|nr:hypothetical protein [Blastocatellia bacterium]